MRTMKVELTLTEPLLGTATANPDVYGEFIASRIPDDPDGEKAQEEENTLPSAEEEIQKATTVFHADEEGHPFLYDYQIKGFFKDACGMLARVKGDNAKSDGLKSHTLKAYKKEIDGLIRVSPRRIMLALPDGEETTFLERPLRASTAQGERICLGRSEVAPAGTTLQFSIRIRRDALEDLVCEWLDYGEDRGLGQWRNSGMGRFTWKLVEG